MHELLQNPSGDGMDEFDERTKDLWRRGAIYVDKVLKGAYPAELPVQQRPNSNWWSLGVTIPEIPEGFLLRADLVIE
jgi:putative ABC transport system substrate-binding protein